MFICVGVIAVYGPQYLRKPTFDDIQQLYEAHERRHGLPGMLGSLDCTHWEWENCPVAWRGQYQRGDHPKPRVMLEAIASFDLWIWHAFFGVAGFNNDLNVLYQSPIFNDIIDGVAPGMTFFANDTEYRYGYYLGDGIYPEWATLVKAFSYPTDDKRKWFKKRQESARKDIERAFGVIKKRWKVIRNPSRFDSKEKMGDVMYTCIILHNMIIEDKGLAICTNYHHVPRPIPTNTVEEKLANRRDVRCRETSNNLRQDLVEHLWSHRPPRHPLD